MYGNGCEGRSLSRLCVEVLTSILLVAGCGSSGQSTDGANGGDPSVLFVADIAHGAIGGFANADPAAGSMLAGRVISGVTGLGGNLAYDESRDSLYASKGGTVVVFDHASLASGAAAPSRTLTPSGSSFVTLSLFLDKSTDQLYVGGDRQSGDGAVLVFANASTVSGTKAPDRTMVVPIGVHTFTLDASRSILYVLGAITGIHVYENANTASGTLSQARVIGGFTSATGLSVDTGRDRLYVADVFAGIRFIADASSPSAAASPDGVPIPNAHFATVDAAHDRLYVGAYDKAYILDDASTLTNALPASAVGALAPAGSSIAGFAFP